MNSRKLIPLTAVAVAAVLIPGGSASNASAAPATAPAADSAQAIEQRPLVIGHRGASGYRPEHTLAAYQLAIEQCADYIEPDLVPTKDGVLVARHENEITGTTDVEDRRRFAGRERTKTIDGVRITGFFTEDFTLAELKTLRAEERIPQLRPQNTEYEDRFKVPTLTQVIKLVRRSKTCDGNSVGIYPETKHPSYFDSIGLSLEEPLVATLEKFGYDSPSDPVFVQSFEVGNLKELDTTTDVNLVQLVNCSGKPFDSEQGYAEMVTPAGLGRVAEYAEGIGACKDVMMPRRADGTLGEPTPVIEDAHDAGLLVHGWTFRAENAFLPTDYRSDGGPSAHGDMRGELREFLDAGMDGAFSDHPDLAVAEVREAS